MTSPTSDRILTAPTEFASPDRGPVTTLFVQPTSCLATPTLDPAQENFYFGRYGPTNYFDPACFPPGSLPTENLRSAEWALYYYSPAICPVGWTQARTYATKIPGYKTIMSVGPGTSAALCCPEGYHSASPNGYGRRCRSYFTPDKVISYVYPTLKGPGTWDLGVSTTIYHAPRPSSVVGDGVVVMWQQTDEAMLAEAESSRGKLETPNGPTSSVATPTTTNSPPQAAAGGLSTGAKAGIGIVVPLVVLAAAIIGWLLLRRRNKSVRSSYVPRVPGELDAGGNDVVELSSAQPPKEIYSQRAGESCHELPP